MSDSYKERIAQLLDAMVAALPGTADEALQSFVRHYYAKMPLNELEQLPASEAAAIAQQSYHFMQIRPSSGVPQLRLIPAGNGLQGRYALEMINDDMPFLLDSVTSELGRQGFHLVRTMHPIFKVTRDAQGTLLTAGPAEAIKRADSTYESFIHIELGGMPEGLAEEKLMADIRTILAAVKLVVDDWQPMMAMCEKTQAELAITPTGTKAHEVRELQEFLEWLRDKNFVFLGSIDYNFYDAEGNEQLMVVPGSELGVFKMDDSELKPQGLQGLPPEVMHFALVPHLVEITKSNRKSVVHRPVQMDYIGIKRFDANGKVIGERRLLGLFTSSVYYQSASTIPLIRRKFERILQRANYDLASHDGKSLKAILEFAPRDELFQISEDDLFEYALGVLALEARPAVRLFTRRDAFERFVSCTVFVPRDRFSTALREQIQTILEAAFDGNMTAFYTQMTDSPLARVHLIVRTMPGNIPAVNRHDIEQKIASVTYGWADALQEALAAQSDVQKAVALARRYSNAFPTSYVQSFLPTHAVYDIARLEHVRAHGGVALELFRRQDYGQDTLHLKLFTAHAQASLSEILPMLENFGFRVMNEMPYRIELADDAAPALWIRDFRLQPTGSEPLDIAAVKARFEEAFLSVWQQDSENDGFNALILQAGLSVREVLLLRTLAKYAKQAAFPYSQEAVVAALVAYPAITRALIQLFTLRFSPEDQGDQSIALGIFQEALRSVRTLEEDRILRHFKDLILAAWRTNYYQLDAAGNPKSYIAIKFNSAAVPDLPLPRMYAEIFVYGARVEGIHLRGGKVARGGLRWSDRKEDYRTEVLGLVKAQMVKNAVIVPVGSKGGFFVKRPPVGGDRDAVLKEGIACYQTYLRGLLDITDNLVQGAVVPPARVVRHDGDDPYLVVAADKGTATFSDYANAVSREYGFWLDDAFASGGSAGYDHKKMGITARGGWVSVERHFREMGHDYTTTPFTVVGIGDMAGDVFGNGMLMSDKIKLLAAFNHMHIFIDPNPDAAKSFVERQRLFNLPRSSWEDYDASVISKGGAIYKRSEKSITLSPEAVAALNLPGATLTPDELMRALLMAPVDLLWNGGIGTYVKAESETNEQVGDRANNPLRVNGRDLRCKVIGEGGNLGFTQLGRIEYALNGGRANTDAIDNSAGVDCSDHEVNIKIAFGGLLQGGDLTIESRDTILASMTDDVGKLVLTDNRLQTQAITVAQQQGVAMLDAQARMMDAFEASGQLNRAVEYLPSSKAIGERRSQQLGLTRPELAVLLSYAKNVLYPQLLQSDFPDDAYLNRDLMRYFPKTMQEQFTTAIQTHPLRREIIATMVTNSIINRGGITFAHSFMEETGMSAGDIARAYVITRDAYDIRAMWLDIEALDGKVPAATQATLFQQAAMFLERTAFWFLRTLPQPMPIAETIAAFQPKITHYMANYEQAITPTVREAYEAKRQRFIEMGTPEDMAHRVARLEIVSNGLDIVHLSNQSGVDVMEVATLYYAAGTMLHMGWLRRATSRMKRSEGHWERLAMQSAINQLSDHQRRITTLLIGLHTAGGSAADSAARWQEQNTHALARYERFIEDVKLLDSLSFPILLVALRNISGLGSN